MEKIKKKLEELGYKYTITSRGELITGRPYAEPCDELHAYGIVVSGVNNGVYMASLLPLKKSDGHLVPLRAKHVHEFPASALVVNDDIVLLDGTNDCGTMLCMFIESSLVKLLDTAADIVYKMYKDNQ